MILMSEEEENKRNFLEEELMKAHKFKLYLKFKAIKEVVVSMTIDINITINNQIIKDLNCILTM